MATLLACWVSISTWLVSPYQTEDFGMAAVSGALNATYELTCAEVCLQVGDEVRRAY